MKLCLKRNGTIDGATLGELAIDGQHECFTLEDPVRDIKPDGSGKVYGDTAIPAGTYKITIDFSQRFQKLMVHILDVPHFTGIRIHSGNDADDTLGCVLVGTHVVSSTRIAGGSEAMPRLFKKIDNALKRGESVEIEIA